jgi:hypothetical protein
LLIMAIMELYIDNEEINSLLIEGLEMRA